MRDDQFGGAIRWRLHLPVTPERVFDTLASDEGRAAFWAESAVEQNGVIDFRFIDGTCTESRIVERQRPDLFSVEYFGSLARFELQPDGAGGTELLLTHVDVSEDDWIEVHAGWLNVLLPLKAWLVGSVDLRNHDPERTWARGYADQ